MRYTGEKELNIWVAMALRILALFLLFVVCPLALALYESVLPKDGNSSFVYFIRFFVRKYYWSILVNSFKVTTVFTLVATVPGLAMAYMLRSVQTRGSKYLNILTIVSYLSPPLIKAYAWTQLLGRNGLFTKIFNSLSRIKLGGIYGFAGIVLVFSLQSFLLVYIYVSNALKNLDNFLSETAESLGCTAFQRMTRTIVPLVMPTMLASFLLVFMCMFSDFGIPILIEKGYKISPMLIYNQFMGEVNTDDHFATAFCIIVVGTTLVLPFLQRYLGSRFTYSMAALKPMATEKCIGTHNVLSHLFVYAVVLITILPQITVIVTSFLAIGGGMVYTGGFPLEDYRNTLSSKNNNTAIFNAHLFGICTIAIVMVFGILVSYLTVKERSFPMDTLDTMTMFPYIIPGSVLGISSLYAFNSKPLPLSGTTVTTVISLFIRRMSYTIRPSTAIIDQISPSAEETAIGLGCTEIESFVKVTVPVMMSGVLSGAIISWIVLISELSFSIILYTSRTQILTAAIYTEVTRSNFGNAAAYSTILTLTSILPLLVFFKVASSNDIGVWSLSMI